MIETDEGLTTPGLRALVAAVSRLDEQVDDGERIDQLAGLERLKSAVAAAQARVTVGFVTSQEQIADGWREHAKACSDAGDFDGWRQARENAARASLEEQSHGANGTNDPDRGPGAGSGAGSGSGRGAGSGGRGRKRPVLANGITAQVALARAESPHRGGEHVRLALALHRHLPSVLAWLKAGVLSEWRATLIVRECAVLSPDLQEVLDAELAGTLGEGVGRLGDRQLVRHVKAIAYRLDPESVLNRARKAEGDRRVSVRPAPDTMAYLTALLPVAQAVAAYAALTTAADAARAGGDDRGRGQVMADTLVERVTGQERAEDVAVEVQVVITDDALFGDDDTPGQVPGYGTVPAGWVRDLLTPEDPDTNDTDGTGGSDTVAGPASDPAAGRRGGAGMREHARVWIRRLYTHPQSGQLVAMDSTRRVFDGNLRRFLLARDTGTCRTPWCDAPIRHLDHIHDHARGGPTTATNGQGLCVRCNHTKQHPGFTARTITPKPRQPGAPTRGRTSAGPPPSELPRSDLSLRVGWDRARPDERHTVELTTPTGHTYRSTAPPLIPGAAFRHQAPDLHERVADAPLSPFERYLTDLIAS
ncbi:MAG: HNH endonuclease [Humibacillus sp.]|nr:HNH endonuclease [Humibacillus sp.]